MDVRVRRLLQSEAEEQSLLEAGSRAFRARQGWLGGWRRGNRGSSDTRWPGGAPWEELSARAVRMPLQVPALAAEAMRCHLERIGDSPEGLLYPGARRQMQPLDWQLAQIPK